ncbi:MAG: ROK family protein [Clostridiales bacterium]|jgi:glucokinase|nr:ROK family protein [Clostridiales bacterium]
MNNCKISFDIGGTNTRFGIVAKECIFWERIVPTRSDLTPADFLAWIDALADETKDADILPASTPIYIAIPGQIQGNTLLRANNLPLQNNMAFPSRMILSNDANSAALAEYLYGAGQGYKTVVMLTFGTGIGSGIIIDGKVISGLNGAAGEVGHMMIDSRADAPKCTCGKRGCWEAIASTTALVARAKSERPNEAWTQNGEAIFAEVRQKNNESAVAIVEQHIKNIAVGISNIINIIAPEVIIIGGGIAEQFDYIHPRLLAHLEKSAYSPNTVPDLFPAFMKNNAGMIGAALAPKP